MIETWEGPLRIADLISMQISGDGTSRILHAPNKRVLLTVYRGGRRHVARVVVAQADTYRILDRRHFQSLPEAVSYVNRLVGYY